MKILAERPGDEAAIRGLIDEAFVDALHSSGTEAAIVDALRAAGALTLSLVAWRSDDIIGHIALSPVTIEVGEGGWFGLGPLCVRPDHRGRGAGQELVRQALHWLEQAGAGGCVVVGDPGYYARFGFRHVGQLKYADVPPPYVQVLSIDGSAPKGEITYHPAFGAA